MVLSLFKENRNSNNFKRLFGEEKENSSSDSDEEFYVHQSLLPFRKSKSSTLGFEGIEAKTVEIKNLGTFKASKVLEVIEKQTAEMLKSQEPEVATFISNTIDYWPPPEEDGEDSELHEAISRRISKAKKSIISENESHGFPLIPFGRTASVDSDGIISVGAWSAPAQVASDSGENSEDEIIGGQKMRSWSATERPCTNENEEEKFCTRKGISLSCERSHHCIYDEIVDELWKGHLSCDDLTEPEIIYDETSDSLRDIDYNQNPFSCIQEMEEYSCSPGLNINLQTPSSFTPSPVMPGSKSDSALKFYACDRPKTPLCGEPNPSNSTQEIYDPWHADAIDDTQQPGPIRSRSCHDTFESTDEEALMLRHCQMCPSPDCKQIIEKQKFSVRDNAGSEVDDDDETDEEEDARIKKAFEAQIEKMQQFADGETASLLVHHEDDGSFEDEEDEEEEEIDGEDCDNRSFTVYDDEIPMADDPTIDSPLNAYL
uniref:Uncharacterized protein n=1 Tax=Panagrolaimus davidi TaxID=227884 RepID=A0A914QPZ0_9BILA